jgi:hypothetical protein
MKIRILIILLTVTAMACNESANEKTELPANKQDAINLQHFYHLYKEISIDGDSHGDYSHLQRSPGLCLCH